ncbi:NAD(+) diphosphatase [Planosporangium mesophilum]|uniref:NAD(+) diphosphatase n=1 Tax=Planosporangium mesophilum TaxID=689768 RepID=UPI001438E973|nr:NAD(+) diphosphatase [Planosporangium mesophilum]NJC81264.1 NAD(+) diphosphatase [Planosporangium mesophilum]
MPPGGRVTDFDRAAHRRTDPEWLARAWVDALVVVVDDGRALVRDEPPGLVLTPSAEVDPGAERYFLGEDAQGRPYFAVRTEVAAPPGTRKANVREVGHVLDEPDASLFITAVALVNWHARHLYSPRTGKPTTVTQGGWTRVTEDGETLFPRTDPAVIVLVHDDVAGPEGRCLLGHNGAWTAPGWARRYSCLAGFVEPGEPAEATVVREVGEEVGVTVRDARYVASQAWPFPGSLMLGYLAVADPDQPVRVDADEITDARWFTRAEVARSLAGDETDFGLPMASSIAHYLVRTWLTGPTGSPAGP